ncbi:MAG: helix-turn-helix domain-containing protein [Thermoleophilia bacterium]
MRDTLTLLAPGSTSLVALSRSRRLPSPAIRRAIRCGAGLTQNDLATALGVSRPAVTRYEAGQREPRGDLRVAYAQVLDALLKDATA